MQQTTTATKQFGEHRPKISTLLQTCCNSLRWVLSEKGGVQRRTDLFNKTPNFDPVFALDVVEAIQKQVWSQTQPYRIERRDAKTLRITFTLNKYEVVLHLFLVDAAKFSILQYLVVYART
jgi:hypothetical protein